MTLAKEPHDSLGMTVAGGMSSRGWDLPVYVTNVDPNGVVGQEGSIRKGTSLVINLKHHSLTHTHTIIHTQAQSLSLSLSLSHTVNQIQCSAREFR